MTQRDDAVAAADARATGYFVVIVPEKDLFQGFYLVAEGDRTAAQTVATIERLLPHNPVPPMTRAETLIGAVSAALIELVLLGSLPNRPSPEDQAAIQTGLMRYGSALAHLVNERWFSVSGRPEQRGTLTTLQTLPPVMEELSAASGLSLPIPVRNPAMARRSIETLPEIIEIKQRIARSVPQDKKH